MLRDTSQRDLKERVKKSELRNVDIIQDLHKAKTTELCMLERENVRLQDQLRRDHEVLVRLQKKRVM